ncbi:MAG: hypothetical protein JOZ50_08255 [Candidatus Eremiobacteraeota bacterium]|nr:hypothetical protein [Candidatus Eremiobacteraeota bacterium]
MSRSQARTICCIAACVASIGLATAARAGTETVAAGTVMQGSMDQVLDSATANVGQHFTLHVRPPYPNYDDTTWSGSEVGAHVIYVQRAGQGRKPELGFVFDKVTLRNGASAKLSADFVSVERKQGSDLAFTAATTVGGMVVGNILGKWLGTNAGGAVGAIGGALYGINHKSNFTVPEGAKVVFELTRPLTINTIASTGHVAVVNHR